LRPADWLAMRTYITRRVLHGLLVLWLVSLVVFSLVRILPGDAVIMQLDQAAAPTPEALKRARQELGLERPFLAQYRTWITGAVQGEGKLASGGSARTLAFGVPAKNPATGAAGNNVVRILAANTKAVPGPYKVASPASVRLEQSIKATDMEPAAVTERWEVRDQSGGTVTLTLEYQRALPARNKTEAKVYGGPDPSFFRIYRVDSGGDVLRSVPSAIDRVKRLQLRVTISDLKKAFDGSEQVVSVTALPWYVREVSLP
jgi:Binding-prot-dependent transport system membrane comp, N-term